MSRAGRTGTTVLAVLGVALVWAVVQGTGLGLAPFHTRGEPREAVVVQDLVQHGHWLLPRRNGVGLPRKPPLYYWLAGLAAQVRGGVDEASVRWPSAALSGLAAVLVAAAAASLFGPRAGLASGIVLLTSFEWIRAATAARVDMTLACGLTAAFVGLLLFRRRPRAGWLVLFYLGVAWATLAKGIPGLAIPALQVVLLCAVDRSPALLRQLRPLRGLLVVVLTAGAWYAAAISQAGRPFIAIVLNENLVRAVGGRQFALGHEHSVAYLLGSLAAGLLPWTLLLPGVALGVWRDRRTLARSDARLFALLWMVAVFVPHAFAVSKRGVYLLPLYPAVAILIGWRVEQLLRGSEARGMARLFAPLAWTTALLLGILAAAAAAEWAGVPLLRGLAPLAGAPAAADLTLVAAAAAASPELALLLAAALLGAVAAALSGARRRWAWALAACALSLTAVIGAVRWQIVPAIARAQSRRPFAEAVRREVGEAGGLATATSLDYGLLYYWGDALPVHDPRAGGPPPRYLVLPEIEWLRMSPVERRRYRRVSGLRIDRSANQGYVVVVQRNESPAPDGDSHRPQEAIER